MFSLKGDFRWAAIPHPHLGFIDGLDGRVARMTGTTSAFGKEYDSLSDVIAFGVAPGIMVYLCGSWTPSAAGLCSGLPLCRVRRLRLARFNIDTSGP
jgi:CDP-diacylglycerol--serine O-phosphatidyltransferase